MITTAAQVLMIFGVFAVIWMVHSILTKGHPLPIGLIFLGGVLGWGMLLLTGLPASWRMRAVVELPAGTTSEVTFDAQSIHTRSDAEESRCEWRAVHILARDNSVVLVGIPGAGMPIPISAFTEIETDFAQLQAWRAAGGSA
ncbi:hypothetical protein [Pseudorhodobacter sp.]|uniref:hypothetical protein n=1 Tax=Pseudorhodobacter sp. TaxID=1934400 RepID=UPI00264A3679|nr:hypothetical protein [Pseudorhodobacter sp.]MDN5785664.1 hypothetical protein [Pseudorhodobacter sp.]